MASKDKACRKFQANIFNKRKCQNCFRAKDAHFLNSEDLRQAKVLYGGWLLLAPDGMNFDNPSHRARKWQRRFFVLFEHGLLRYALDEMTETEFSLLTDGMNFCPSTLPQGTIDMTLCSDVLDAESLTGQSNSLCILSPDAPHAQHFIRTHSRESMQGWRESLLHFVKGDKENLERKRKEPGLPKESVTMSDGSKASRTRLRGAPCICPREHEEQRDQSAIPCSHSAPSLQQLEHGLLSQSRFSSESLEDCTEQGMVVGGRKKQRVDCGYFSLERNQSGTCSPPPPRPCHLPLPLPLPCSRGPQGPHRYTSPDSDPPTSPFSTLGSQDSELSPGTPISVTTPPCCDDVGGAAWAGRGQGCGRYASLADVPRAKPLSSRPTRSPPAQQQRRARSPGREEVVRLFGRERRRPPVIAKFETLEGGVEHVRTSTFLGPSSSSVRAPRKSQSARRHLSKSQTSSLEVSADHSMPVVSKSSQGGDCRSEAAKLRPQKPSESCVTPDLLNFKKGWLTKLHEDGTWQKHWFVLTDQSLRFFRDSAAEEAADLDGEMDLSTCYDVTEFSVPRKYSLQVHTRDGAFMLCAMTARIRRNWIQAIEKIVRPAIAPNATCPPLSLHAAHRKTASFKLSVLKPSPLPEEWAQGQAGVAEIRPSLESPEEDRTVQAGSSCDSGLCNPIQDRRSYDCGDLAPKEGTVPPGGAPEEGTDSVDGSCSSLSFSSSPPSSCSSVLDSEEEVLGEEPEVRHGVGTHNNTLTALPEPMAAVAGRVGGPLVSDVEDEMEQRWLRVETTPLYMESLVPTSAPLSPATAPDEAPLRAIWLGSKGPLPPCPRSDSCQQRSQLNIKQQLDLSAQEYSLSPAEILALQAKLSNTTTKLIAGTSTAAWTSGEISVVREPLMDWRAKMVHSEHSLQAQLRDTQTQLEEVEASLQERSREVQELRERLSDVTASLMATEEAQALERERLQESWEEERQRRQEQLAEVEARRHSLEIRLRAAELKVQTQQREHTDLEHQLAEQLSTQTGTIQDLMAMIQRLRDEKDQLTSRCQELLNQITAADNEVDKLQSCLKAGEIDKNGLESYQTLYEEFKRVTRVLWEREEQIKEMRDMHERQVEMKQKDLNEALDQVSSLEREFVYGVKPGSMEPCAVQRDLQDKLTAAERRIVDLELELLSMQEAHDALMKASSSLQEDPDVQEASRKQDQQLLGDSAIKFSLTDAAHPEVIRNIQDSPVSEHVPSEVYGSSDPLLESIAFADGGLDAEKFISIIQALETKLYSSEEKLKAITLKMKEEEGLRTEALNEQLSQWAKLEKELCSQLHEGASRVYQLSSQLQEELDKKHVFNGESNCSVCAGNSIACLEHGGEKVKVQRGLQEGNDKSHILSEVDAELIKTALNLRQGGSPGKRVPDHHGIQNLETRECKIWRLDSMKLSAKILEFEALILKKVAFLVQNPIGDILQSLGGNCEGVENCKSIDRGYMEIMYAEILARKLMAGCEFWAEMEQLEAQTQVAGDVNSCGCIQTTLENSLQSLKALYDEKFQKLERELQEAQAMLNCQEFPLKEVVGTSEQVDSNRFGKGLNEDIHCSHGRMKDDTGPPDLCPYFEQVRMYEAGESSEEMVSGHLQEGSLTCSGRAVDYPPVFRDRLATELKIKAEVLQRLSHKIKLTLEMENACLHPRLVNVLSTEHCSPAGDGAGGSLSMQKNIPDVACELSVVQERDLELCKQAHKSIGLQCPEYSKSVDATPECCLTSLQECKSLEQAVASLREENQTLRHEVSRLAAELSLQQEETERLEERFRVEAEELNALCELEISQAEQRSAANELSLMEKMADCQQKLEVLLLDIDGMEDRHEEDVRALEAQFQERIDVLLSTHQKELERLQSQGTQTLHTLQGGPDRLRTRQSQDPMLLAPALPFSEQALSTEGQGEDTDLLELDSVMVLRQRIQELEDQEDELTNNKPEGDLSHPKEQYQRDLHDFKAACERGFAAVEEAHCQEIREIRRQHQREVSGLLQEQERLLAEETAATVTAVEALKSSDREELERLQRSELHGETPNILELRELHRLQAADRELEVLSVLFSQKCLESSQLAQALESERRALSRCQRENQELDTRLQELNYRLTVELTRMRSSHLLKEGNDLYEVEELVRTKDSEIRCLKREVFSLRNELRSVLRDRSNASDNHRDSCAELSVVKAEAGCDISGLEEQLSPATEALPTAAGDDTRLKESSDLCGLLTGVRSEFDIEHTWDD